MRYLRLFLPLAAAAAAAAAAASAADAQNTALETPPAPLVTDRPDFTESAVTVRPGRVQLEAGYTFTRSGAVRDHTIGELLGRVGVHSRAELRVGLNSYQVMERSGENVSGLQDLSLGLKLSLWEGAARFRPLRPTAAILVGAVLPTGEEELGGGDGAVEGTLALAWPLGPRWSLGSNVGAAWLGPGDDSFAQFSGSVALGLSLDERTGAFVEGFGFSSPDAAGTDALFANGGLTYLISPDLQLDGRVGIGFDDPRPNYFAGVGIAYRW